MARKIDVHVHVLPPTWREESARFGLRFPVRTCQQLEIAAKWPGLAGNLTVVIQEWTAEATLRSMDALGIEKSILSVTAPGIHLDPQDDRLARRLAREANEFMGQVAKENPGRFGFFATLPLPDCEGAKEEAEYALNILKADGIGLLANNHGIYLGDKLFDHVFQALDLLEAKVFIHPNTCRFQHCNGVYQAASEPIPSLPGSVLEYMFDSTRAVTNLLVSGTVSRYPNLSFIMSHCGAVLPATLDRSTEFMARALGRQDTITAEEARSLLRTRFYFDLAGFVCSDQLPAILRIVSSDRLLYGSDLPFTPINVAKDLMGELESYLQKNCGEEAAQAVFEANIQRFFM